MATHMSVLETIAARRSIFDFQPTAVPRARLERALQAAVWAPNHKLTEPWRFIVVGPEAKDRLSRVYARIKQQGVKGEIDPEALREIGRKTVKKLMSKPSIVAVTCAGVRRCLSRSRGLRRHLLRHPEHHARRLGRWYRHAVEHQRLDRGCPRRCRCWASMRSGNGSSACCTPASPSACPSRSERRPPNAPPG